MSTQPMNYDLAAGLAALNINLSLLPDGKGHWQGRNGFKPAAIVFHITDGDDNTVAWFHSPECNAAAHFTIDRDGTLYQFVRTSDTAWSNGSIQGQPAFDNVPWLKTALDHIGTINPNYFTISIEHVGHPANGVTEAQVLKSIQLATYLMHRWNIPAQRDTFIRHSDMDTITRAFCPGELFPLGRIIEACGGKL